MRTGKLANAAAAPPRIGRRRIQQTRKDAKSQISTIEAGILGVLGLLLGFTGSMAVMRFEMRKQLVLEELMLSEPPICARSSYPRPKVRK